MAKAKKSAGAKKAKKGAPKGGSRPGSGRRMMYGSPLSKFVAVFLNEQQIEAVVSYCRKKRRTIAFFLREVALEHAGLRSLGLGLDADVAPGWAEPSDTGSHWPVMFTARQHAALTAYCKAKNVSVRRFVVESALAHVGRPDLGMAGEVERVAAAVKR